MILQYSKKLFFSDMDIYAKKTTVKKVSNKEKIEVTCQDKRM